MLNHPISYLIAQLKVQKTFTIKKTKDILAVVDVLQAEGLITYQYNPFLKFIKVLTSNISKINVISKPGRRIYITTHNIPTNTGLGIYLIKTSKGIITDLEAKRLNLGGELILQVM